MKHDVSCALAMNNARCRKKLLRKSTIISTTSVLHGIKSFEHIETFRVLPWMYPHKNPARILVCRHKTSKNGGVAVQII
jgi:hypothetical protein